MSSHTLPYEHHDPSVYVMQAGEHGPVKIGHSRCVDKRRQILQPGNPWPLRILTMEAGTQDDEREVHRRFADARIANSEWFYPTAALMAAIQEGLL